MKIEIAGVWHLNTSIGAFKRRCLVLMKSTKAGLAVGQSALCLCMWTSVKSENSDYFFKILSPIILDKKEWFKLNENQIITTRQSKFINFRRTLFSNY